MAENEPPGVAGAEVLTFACDCEFVALAQELGVPLVTGDARVRKEFPRTAVGMREFGGR